MEQNVCEKWDKVGMLQGIPEDRKEKVANACEFALMYMIDQEEKKIKGEESQFETIVFPIICKIVKEIDITEEEIIEIGKTSILELKKFIDRTELNQIHDIYWEAEFVHQYSEDYINKYKSKEINGNLNEGIS